MVQPETRLQNQIRLAVSANCQDVTLYRNHTGALRDNRGKFVQFGLSPGSPDLVGYKKVCITEDMVGQDLAVFIGMEIKMPGEIARDDQQCWLNRLEEHGGIACVVHSETEAITYLS
jgi:hypothetical protein